MAARARLVWPENTKTVPIRTRATTAGQANTLQPWVPRVRALASHATPTSDSFRKTAPPAAFVSLAGTVRPAALRVHGVPAGKSHKGSACRSVRRVLQDCTRVNTIPAARSVLTRWFNLREETDGTRVCAEKGSWDWTRLSKDVPPASRWSTDVTVAAQDTTKTKSARLRASNVLPVRPPLTRRRPVSGAPRIPSSGQA